MKTKGEPPRNLTGQMPVKALDSPWWDGVASEITRPGGLVGRTLSIEELTELIPSYPDGRRPRPRAVARRLGRVLRLVERGPNGSRGRGAIYQVVAPPPPPDAGRDDVEADEVPTDLEYLEQVIRKMTKED